MTRAISRSRFSEGRGEEEERRRSGVFSLHIFAKIWHGPGKTGYQDADSNSINSQIAVVRPCVPPRLAHRPRRRGPPRLKLLLIGVEHGRPPRLAACDCGHSPPNTVNDITHHPIDPNHILPMFSHSYMYMYLAHTYHNPQSRELHIIPHDITSNDWGYWELGQVQPGYNIVWSSRCGFGLCCNTWSKS